MRTSQNYLFTLPVVHGVIQDPQQRLPQLRLECRAENALIAKDTRFVVDLKYRGPRCGQHYNTPRDAADAVDVYLRERRGAAAAR